MTQQTITILRKETLANQPTRDEVDADVEGSFAIHESLPVQLDTWTLTHIPTGYAVLTTEHRGQCVAARAELLASDLDWTFSDPKAVTPAHRTFGRKLREKYERR